MVAVDMAPPRVNDHPHFCRLLLQDGIDERLVNACPLIAAGNEIAVGTPSVEEVDDDPLYFCCLDGRQEVAVPCDDRGIGNLMLCCKKGQVYPHEDVNPLLLEDRVS